MVSTSEKCLKKVVQKRKVVPLGHKVKPWVWVNNNTVHLLHCPMAHVAQFTTTGKKYYLSITSAFCYGETLPAAE